MRQRAYACKVSQENSSPYDHMIMRACDHMITGSYVHTNDNMITWPYDDMIKRRSYDDTLMTVWWLVDDIAAENVVKRVAAVWRCCCWKRGRPANDDTIIWSYDHMIVYASYDHVIIWSHDHMVIWSYDHTWSSYDHTIARSRAHMIIWSYDHMLTSSYDRMIICSYDHMIIWLYYHMTIWSYDRAIIRSHDLLPLLVWPLLPSTNMWKRAGKGDPFCRLMTPFTVDNPVFQTCAQQGVSI